MLYRNGHLKEKLINSTLQISNFFLYSFIFYILFYILYTSNVSVRQEISTEQWPNLKFLVRLGKLHLKHRDFCSNTNEDETMFLRVFEWSKRLKERSEKVEDDSRSGKPSTTGTEVNVERVRCGVIVSWLFDW